MPYAECENLDKVCPLRELAHVLYSQDIEYREEGAYCLRGKCAWWNPVTKLCAVSALFVATSGIRI
jgi:hypothetical protein